MVGSPVAKVTRLCHAEQVIWPSVNVELVACFAPCPVFDFWVSLGGLEGSVAAWQLA